MSVDWQRPQQGQVSNAKIPTHIKQRPTRQRPACRHFGAYMSGPHLFNNFADSAHDSASLCGGFVCGTHPSVNNSLAGG